MSDSILIIPDIHQNHDFFARSLEAGLSRPEVGEIVLLGDLLDPKDEAYMSFDAALRTIDLLAVILRENLPPVTLLWGNHDWNYWFHRNFIHANPDSVSARVAMQFMERGLYLTTGRALLGDDPDYPDIPENTLNLWIDNALLATIRHGFLISHAGLMPDYWPALQTPEQCIQILNTNFTKTSRLGRRIEEIPLAAAGFARGGDRPVGGPLWLDWDCEFEDCLPLPQIVGHTRGEGIRRKGRSHCLDACQTLSAILHPDKTLETLLIPE